MKGTDLMFVDSDGKEQKVSDDVPDEMYEDMLHSMAKLRDEFNRHSNVTNPGPTDVPTAFTKEAARAMYNMGGLEGLKRGIPAHLNIDDVLKDAGIVKFEPGVEKTIRFIPEKNPEFVPLDIMIDDKPPESEVWYTLPLLQHSRKLVFIDVGKFESDLKKIVARPCACNQSGCFYCKPYVEAANMFFWPGSTFQIEPLPDIDVDLPEVMNMSAQWKKDGLCPKCGSKGEWISMAAVCKDHGKFMG